MPVDAALLQLDFLNTNPETASASTFPCRTTWRSAASGRPASCGRFHWATDTAVWRSGGYIKVKVTGPLGQIETTGFSDPSITFHANFSGAPALRGDQIAQAIPQSYMSVSPYKLTLHAARTIATP